jgi:hypothetical protein
MSLTDTATGISQITPAEHRNTKKRGNSRATSKAAEKEAILREEVRSIRQVWLYILQWGITVMIAAGSVIFYARQAIKADLIAGNALSAG